MIGIAYTIHIFAGPIIENAKLRFGTPITHIGLAINVITAGFLAYEFKRRSLFWYGVVEVIFGVVNSFAITLTMKTVNPELAQIGTLTGCAYVIVRGLSNAQQAYVKDGTN
jgi:hypothetical protein